MELLSDINEAGREVAGKDSRVVNDKFPSPLHQATICQSGSVLNQYRQMHRCVFDNGTKTH